MHLYCLTRGIKHDVDRFITELQGKYLPYKFQKGEKGLVQFSVRPVQLWEMVFPEEHLQAVMKTFFSTDNVREGFSYSHKNDKTLTMLRIALRCNKFPKMDKITSQIPVYKKNIEIAGIGIKKDEYKNGIEQL